MTSNQEILKNLTTTSLTNGGTLNNKQQDRFLELVRAYGNLLPRVRFVRMTQANQEIDKMHLGEPVTRAAAENSYPYNTPTSSGNVEPTYPYKIVPKFNKIRLSATKVRSDWAISTESLQNNIAGNSLEGSVMGAIAERMAHDMEELAINGDTSTTVTGAFADSPINKLRDIMNGWDVLTNDAIILDVNGSYISKQVWGDMIRIQPKEHKSDPGMMFIASDNVSQDWQEMLSERVGSVGDSALQGGGIAPYGRPLLRNSIMRDDKLITTTNANAKLISQRFGPYDFTASATLRLVVDGTTTNITFPATAGTWDTNQVIAFLTPSDGFGGTSLTSKAVYIGTTSYTATYDVAFATGFRAAELGDGRFVLYTVGTTNTISQTAASGNIDHILGLSESTGATAIASSDFGSTTSKAEGSFIWLVNPKNFIWGVLDGTRIFTEYNKDTDMIESVVYNQVAAAVEESRAVVKAINVRAKNGWPI